MKRIALLLPLLLTSACGGGPPAGAFAEAPTVRDVPVVDLSYVLRKRKRHSYRLPVRPP